MCQHQAGINSAGLEIRKENPSWGSMGLGIPGERHSSSGASPATAFLAGAGLHMGITLGSMYSCSPSPLSHPPAADLCRLSGGLQGEGGAGGAAMPACLPPKVSKGTDSRGFPAGDSHPPPISLLRRCLVKWLEVRCVCPMCNKPMAGPAQPHAGIGTLLDEMV